MDNPDHTCVCMDTECMICIDPIKDSQPVFYCKVCRSNNMHLSCAVEWFLINHRNPCCNTNADIDIKAVPQSVMESDSEAYQRIIKDMKQKLQRLSILSIILLWGYLILPIMSNIDYLRSKT